MSAPVPFTSLNWCIRPEAIHMFSLLLGDQDTGASFSGWSETNYPLGEAEEQVLNLLLAESTSFDPLLDNIEWGDDAYSSEVNLNPD